MQLNFVTSIVGVAGPDGKKNFTPKQVMLHNQGSLSAHSPSEQTTHPKRFQIRR